MPTKKRSKFNVTCTKLYEGEIFQSSDISAKHSSIPLCSAFWFSKKELSLNVILKPYWISRCFPCLLSKQKTIKKLISILQELFSKLWSNLIFKIFLDIKLNYWGLALVDGFYVFASTIDFDVCIDSFAVLINKFWNFLFNTQLMNRINIAPKLSILLRQLELYPTSWSDWSWDDLSLGWKQFWSEIIRTLKIFSVVRL